MSREAPSATNDISRIVRDFLAGAIDYAGLFPPAAVDMRAAVRNYASYRSGEEAALLGRFVVPAARLHELAAELESLDVHGIRASAVLGANVSSDFDVVTAFNANAGRAIVDAIEAKMDRPGTIYELASRGSSSVDVFVELPIDAELELLVAAVHAVGARAKIRTG